MLVFDIEAEQDSVGQPGQNKWAINKRLAEASKNKFQLGIYTKGYFHSDLAVDHGEFQYHNHSSHIQFEQKKNSESPRKRARRVLKILQPIKQAQNIQVFENKIKQQTPKDPQLSSTIARSFQTRRKAQKQSNRSQKTSRTSVIKQQQSRLQFPKIQNLFYENSQDDQPTNNLESSNPQIAQKSLELKNNQKFTASLKQQVPERQQKSYYQPPRQKPIKSASSKYFKNSSICVFKKQLMQQTKTDNSLRLILMRDKEGLNAFWPEFHLHFHQRNEYVMSAKRTSSKPTSTFILSASKKNFQENSQCYLGKMKSNLMGDVLNIFGPGLNPSNAKEKCCIPRQIIATIVYKSGFFKNSGPREFKVFVKKEQYKYYSSFPQVVMYREEIPLNLLYDFPQNKQKIKAYNNRKPIWVEKYEGYRLNFRGRALCSSTKNFILQEQIIGPDVAVFGKINQSHFNLDVFHPISPLVAFAVALSSFDTRMMCQ